MRPAPLQHTRAHFANVMHCAHVTHHPLMCAPCACTHQSSVMEDMRSSAACARLEALVVAVEQEAAEAVEVLAMSGPLLLLDALSSALRLAMSARAACRGGGAGNKAVVSLQRFALCLRLRLWAVSLTLANCNRQR